MEHQDHFYLRTIEWAAKQHGQYTRQDALEGARLSEEQFGFLHQRNRRFQDGTVFVDSSLVESNDRSGTYQTTTSALLHQLELDELRQARMAAAEARVDARHAIQWAATALCVNIVFAVLQICLRI